jgi:MYXO-CTERM domain-containing protein
MNRLCLAAAIVAAGGVAAADVINFDDLMMGDVVTTQYAGVTFSTVAGQQNQVHAFSNGGTSLPNILCTADNAGGINCLYPTYLDFSTAVNGLTFLAVEPNGSGEVASVNIFQSGVFSTNVPIIGLGSGGGFGAGNVLVDLSAYGNITRIELVGPGGAGLLDEAGNGIGWDDFSFTPVPTPGSAALLALGGLMAIRRRR